MFSTQLSFVSTGSRLLFNAPQTVHCLGKQLIVWLKSWLRPKAHIDKPSCLKAFHRKSKQLFTTINMF